LRRRHYLTLSAGLIRDNAPGALSCSPSIGLFGQFQSDCLTRRLLALKDETARRLMSIPGFGPITASAMAATFQDASSFAGPRAFAAYLGLTPKQSSSGGRQRLGRISRMGNRNLRNPARSS
jgi:transposase